MSRTYQFADLVALSELSVNAVKHLIQREVVQADVKDTEGSGDHRTFSFLDLFETRLVSRLYELPGGCPIEAVSRILDAMRVQTELDALGDAGWGLFLDPATRDTSQNFFLCWVPGQRSSVLERAALEARVTSGEGVVVTIRLDTLLLELEQKTKDHTTAAERSRAWKKFRRRRPTRAARRAELGDTGEEATR